MATLGKNWDTFLPPPLWLLMGSPILMEPHLSQQHAGLQHAVRQQQQEVIRPKAKFKPSSNWGTFYSIIWF